MSNIKILYPHTPYDAVKITPTPAMEVDREEFNLIDGERYYFGKFDSDLNDYDIEFDLGTGNANTADYLLLAKADILRRQHVHTIKLERSDDAAAWTTEQTLTIEEVSAEFGRTNNDELTRTSSSPIQISGSEDFTIAFWINPLTSAGLQFLISKWDFGAADREYNIAWVPSISRFRAQVSNDGTAEISVTANNFGAPVLTDWHFIVFTHDSVNDTINISVNGGTADSTAHATGVNAGASVLRIGRESTADSDSKMKKIGFWKGEVLSAAHQAFLYNDGKGRNFAEIGNTNSAGAGLLTNLSAWWTLDEISDGTGVVNRADEGQNFLELTDVLTVPSSPTTAPETLRGPRSEDLFTTFTETTSHRYWRVVYEGDFPQRITHSKLYFGNALDLGDEPTDIVFDRMNETSSEFIPSAGNTIVRRTSEPPYMLELKWEGITDAKRTEFKENIARHWRRRRIFIVTTTDHEILDNFRAIHCEIIADPIITKINDDYNDIQLQLKEILG